MLYPAKGMQNIPVLGRISPMGWLEFYYLRMKETLQKTFSLWQIRKKQIYWTDQRQTSTFIVLSDIEGFYHRAARLGCQPKRKLFALILVAMSF